MSDELHEFIERLLPRMLTQVCRDPGSPGYGSFDRNWWHYKIRDFSSIILQQGGYALYCAAELPQFEKGGDSLRRLAAASCRFWNDRAKKHGAFEEYYPWEQGYPPVAFSTLVVAKMVADGVVGKSDVLPGLKVAARQLQSRFESKATNQQVAGTAALCWIRKIAPELIDEDAFAEICNRTLNCQHEEGWYMEYGGPDLGYLSVTMDCLWDAYDASGDERFRDSAAKALGFILPFVQMPQRGAGMHNARNTDYIVPYGIARFLQDEQHAEAAGTILTRIFEHLDDSQHFLHAIDDRYQCHYIGHSLFRAVGLMGQVKGGELRAVDQWFEGTGHWLRSDTPSECSAMVSAKKGGIFSLDFPGASCADFGWLINADGQDWVSHWWADFWTIDRQENRIIVSGCLTPHRENVSNPFKHLVLRSLSLVFGRRIINVLKEKMIFKNKQDQGPAFTRTIEFKPDGVAVIDILGVENPDKPVRAPRSSKRHVASADSYHMEDLMLRDAAIEMLETRVVKTGCVEITTIYRRKP